MRLALLCKKDWFIRKMYRCMSWIKSSWKWSKPRTPSRLKTRTISWRASVPTTRSNSTVRWTNRQPPMTNPSSGPSFPRTTTGGLKKWPPRNCRQLLIPTSTPDSKANSNNGQSWSQLTWRRRSETRRETTNPWLIRLMGIISYLLIWKDLWLRERMKVKCKCWVWSWSRCRETSTKCFWRSNCFRNTMWYRWKLRKTTWRGYATGRPGLR